MRRSALFAPLLAGALMLSACSGTTPSDRQPPSGPAPSTSTEAPTPTGAPTDSAPVEERLVRLLPNRLRGLPQDWRALDQEEPVVVFRSDGLVDLERVSATPCRGIQDDGGLTVLAEAHRIRAVGPYLVYRQFVAMPNAAAAERTLGRPSTELQPGCRSVGGRSLGSLSSSAFRRVTSWTSQRARDARLADLSVQTGRVDRGTDVTAYSVDGLARWRNVLVLTRVVDPDFRPERPDFDRPLITSRGYEELRDVVIRETDRSWELLRGLRAR